MLHPACLSPIVGPLRLLVLGCLPALSAERLAAQSESSGKDAPAQPAPPAREEFRWDERLAKVEKEIELLRKLIEDLRAEIRKPDAPVPGAVAPAAVSAATTAGAADGRLPADWVKSLKWRSIGPAGMGGRITAISVFEADPCVWWVATASGGLLKTENNGVTFVHRFDREATVSVGDVCVAPSDKDIVWVGTGENNPRNSVSWGDGVYKSTDGGKTWTNMGLRRSFQIGRIAVHPTSPDVVYVGALGRLYGPNEERGLFKTTDGGKTWEKVFYVDDKTGVIDVAMHPEDPETLIVATWERRRDGFDSHRGEPPVADGFDVYDPIEKWGPGAGIFKTADGGRTWKRLSAGLPSLRLGRVDVEYYRKDPNVLYAIIDCEKIGMGTPPSRAYLGARGEDGGGGARLIEISPRSPAAKAELKPGDVVKAVDRKPVASYAVLVESLRAMKPGDKVVLEVVRGGETLEVAATLETRPLGAGGPGSGVYLGVQGEDLEGGAKLTQVTAESPAAKAGLKEGDIVEAADEVPIAGYEQLAELIRTHKAGESMVLDVVRDGKKLQVTATLQDRPFGPAGAGRGARGGPGGELAMLLGARGEDSDKGFRIERVFDERAAEKAGIEAGDVIQNVIHDAESKPIAGAEDLVAILREKKEGDKVTLKLLRGSETKEVTVTLEEPAGAGTRSPARPWAYMYAGQQPNVQDQQGPDGHEYGGVYRSADGGESWTRVNSLNPRPMYFSQVRVDPSDDRYVYVLGVALHRSRDGGRTFTADGGRRVHADHHALWIDPRDGRHMILGTDGGFYATFDRMANWEHLNHMAIAQFYHVTVDSREPYRVYGGLQDNGSWGGPSLGLDGGTINADWIAVGGGDGFVCRVDPFDPDLVYAESQNGAMGRRNLRTGERASIRPRPPRGQRYRFNWNTPFILSGHNPGIFYCAGDYVFRSVKRGDDLRVISPAIARTGRGTGTALAESPRNPDLLWVGTDDGNLWVTLDGGREWKNVADRFGLPGPRWVATVEPSRHADGRCYVAFDGHRSDDDEPYLFVTEDSGQTWTPIRSNLPAGSTRCLREDPKAPDLLFCGTEFAVWVSTDRGRCWIRLNSNLPTVAVHELAIHPTVGEMVAATHGRSLWVLDITPLREMGPEVVNAAAHLFEPNAVVRWRSEPSRGVGGGSQHFRGENPPRTAQLYYSLAKKPESLSLKVLDHTGRTVRELEARPEVGLNVVAWDLTQGPSARERAATTAAPPSAERRATPSPQVAASAGAPQGATRVRSGAVPPGLYRVVLAADGQEHAQTLRVLADPTLPSGVAAVEVEEDEREVLRRIHIDD